MRSEHACGSLIDRETQSSACYPIRKRGPAMLKLLQLADLHLGWAPAYMEEPRSSERRRRRDDLPGRAVESALGPSNRIGMALMGWLRSPASGRREALTTAGEHLLQELDRSL